MLVTELLNDGKLIRTYSDAGWCIRQETGAIYTEAVDVYPSEHTYEEVEGMPVEEEQEEDHDTIGDDSDR